MKLQFERIFKNAGLKKGLMKILILVVVVLVTKQAFGQSMTEAEILQISKTKFRWQLESKFDSLANLFDDKITLQHGNGHFQSKTEYFNTLKSGMLKYLNINVTEQAVNVIENTAVLVGKVKFTISLNGEKKDFDFSFTEVYAQGNNSWKLVLYAFRNNVQ